MNKLTVVTITYNNLKGLMRTADSVHSKFCPLAANDQIEHVIVDGGSDDGTIEYCLSLKSNSSIPVNFRSERDFGIYDAMNKGVRRSSGDFLVFINAGDEVHDTLNVQKLFEMLEGISSEKSVAGLALCSEMKFLRSSLLIASRYVDACSPRMPSVHQSMVYKRSILLDIPYDSSFKVCGDYQNFVRILLSGLKFKAFDMVFSVFYAGGVSSRSPLLLFRESVEISFEFFDLSLIEKLILSFRLAVSLIGLQVLLLIYGIDEQKS